MSSVESDPYLQELEDVRKVARETGNGFLDGSATFDWCVMQLLICVIRVLIVIARK